MTHQITECLVVSQLIVGAACNDRPLLHQDDRIEAVHVRKTMRHNHSGDVLPRTEEQ